MLDRGLRVGRKQQVTDIAVLRLRAIRTFFTELGASLLGGVGIGWINSGRPAFGWSVFLLWFSSWLIYVEWNLAAQSQLYGPDFHFVLPVIPLYFGMALTSAICASLTYWRRGLKRKIARPAPSLVVESNALLIEDAPATVAD
jgi:hypothetical protein